MGNASMSDLQELRFLEIDECIRNPVYFCEHYGHIEDRTKDEIVQPFRLWPAQRQALKELKENKQNIILKARQLGFSWLVVHYAITVMLRPGRVVVGLSRSENEAMELIAQQVNEGHYNGSFDLEDEHGNYHSVDWSINIEIDFD